MGKVLITESLLNNLANSISTKTGEPTPMTLTEMKTAVDDLTIPTLQTSKSYTVSASGNTAISPDSSYDAMEEVALTVPAGTATSASTISGSSASISIGTNTITLSKSVSNTPRITTAGYISSGTAGSSSVSLTASVTTKGTATITPSTFNQTISSGTYITGTQTISGDVNLVAGNIKKDVSIFNVTGTYEGSGGGGGSWTLLGAQDYEVNTTSTSSTVVGTISCGAGAWTSNKIIYVKVRDKAGARNGHFVGSDAFFYNYGAANGATSGLGKMQITIRRNNDGKYGTTPSSGNTAYGVYGFSVNTDGDVSIRSQYNNAYSTIIDGTYRVEVYALDYAPDQGNPFNYSFN